MRVTSTASVAVAERVEYWEAWNQSSLVGLRCSTPVPDRFNATARQTDLNGVTVTRIQADQHVIDRNVQSIAAAPKHSVFVSALLKGSAFVYHAQGLRLLHAGDMLQYSTMYPYLLGFDQDMDLLILDVDADIAVDSWGKHPGQVPEVSPADPASRRLVVEAMRALDHDRPGSPGHQPDTSERLTRLAREVMTRQTSNEALLEHALALIDLHLCDPGFKTSDLAGLLHVSDRHLRRIFAAHHEPPGAALLSARLHRAEQQLTNPGHATISDIALACGFGSPSSFSRAFRSRFGTSPAQLRTT